MNQFSVFDESFDTSLSSSYYLSIRISPGGFSFCILDPIYNKIIQFKECLYKKPDLDWSETIHRLKDEELLKLHFKRRFFICEGDVYTLVPNALFKSENMQDVLSGTFDVNLSEMQMLTDKVKMVDATNLYCVPINLYHFIVNNFSDSQIIHHLTPLVELTMLDDYRGVNQIFVHVFFRKSSFDVLVMDRRELKLANHFSFSDDNEIIYYLLFIFEQLRLHPGTTDVHVSGDIHIESSRYLLLKSYLKTVQLAVFPSHFQFSDVLQPVNLVQHYLLFNSFICV